MIDLFDDDLAALTSKWPTLTQPTKLAILALANMKPARKRVATPTGYNAVPMWCDAWKVCYHVFPTISGPEAKWLKELATMYPQAQLAAMMKAYFEDRPRTLSVWEFYKNRNTYGARCPVVLPALDPDDILEALERR